MDIPRPPNPHRPFPKLLLLLPAILMGVLGFLYWQGMQVDPNTLPSPVLNRPLPAFSLPSLADPGRRLDPSALRGPAVINFWASWCLACRDENPQLLRLRDQGVTVYGVDYLDQQDEALRWLEREGSPFAEVVFDAEGQLGRDMGLYGTPETYVIDREGVVRHRRIGQIDARAAAELLRQINSLRAN